LTAEIVVRLTGENMAYRNIVPVLIDIDNLSGECGLFCTGDNIPNGGYGCASKFKNKQEPGCCNSWDCPLAYNATIDDLKKHDSILYEQYKDDPWAHEDCGDWMVKYRECVTAVRRKDN